MRCLLTGSTGFIGKALCCRLGIEHQFFSVLKANRQRVNGDDQIVVGEITGATFWGAALHGVDVVVHLAARAHMLDEKSLNPLQAFRETNVEGTLNLAKQAAASGVRRFVFISSIGVNGAHSRQPFTSEDKPNPTEPYSLSKLEAEQGLLALAASSGMEVVIIRPPLVYGPGAPGNFGRLARAVAKGVPLPFGSVHNRRTLVFVENLVDLITVCMVNPAAANQVFLAGDGEDMSTTNLLKRLGGALGRSACLFPMPVRVLELIFSLIGRRSLIQKICGDLQVDISKAKELLGWVPPVSVDEALEKTASYYLVREGALSRSE